MCSKTFSNFGEINSSAGFQNNDSARIQGALAGKAPKAWTLPRLWVSIGSYKKQLVKKIWGRILGLVWLKFSMAPMQNSDSRVELVDRKESQKV